MTVPSSAHDTPTHPADASVAAGTPVRVDRPGDLFHGWAGHATDEIDGRTLHHGRIAVRLDPGHPDLPGGGIRFYKPGDLTETTTGRRAQITLVARHVRSVTAHDVRSPYVEVFWLPVIGPSALWLLRLAAIHTFRGPVTFDMVDLSQRLGLGAGIGPNSSVQRTVRRLEAFHLATWLDDGSLAVARWLPPLSQQKVARLPETLQAAHARYLATSSVAAAVIA